MFSRIKNYFDFTHFKGDLFGGLTAGVVALPLALAFGVTFAEPCPGFAQRLRPVVGLPLELPVFFFTTFLSNI